MAAIDPCRNIARAFLAVIEAPVGAINGQAFNVGLNTDKV